MSAMNQRSGPTLRTLTLLAAVAGLAVTSSDVRAQDAGDDSARRTGIHFAIGLGAGSVSASCPGCGTNFFEDRLTGLAGTAQLGFFPSPKLAVGLEFMGWLKNDDPVYRRMAALGVTVLGYPSEGGFFVKGTFGGIRAIGENDAIIVRTDAFMAATGIGYDVRVGPKLSFTAYADYVRAFGAGTWVNNVSSDVIVTPNALQAGIALTIH